jgi:hypothetical protein
MGGKDGHRSAMRKAARENATSAARTKEKKTPLASREARYRRRCPGGYGRRAPCTARTTCVLHFLEKSFSEFGNQQVCAGERRRLIARRNATADKGLKRAPRLHIPRRYGDARRLRVCPGVRPAPRPPARRGARSRLGEPRLARRARACGVCRCLGGCRLRDERRASRGHRGRDDGPSRRARDRWRPGPAGGREPARRARRGGGPGGRERVREVHVAPRGVRLAGRGRWRAARGAERGGGVPRADRRLRLDADGGGGGALEDDARARRRARAAGRRGGHSRRRQGRGERVPRRSGAVGSHGRQLGGTPRGGRALRPRASRARPGTDLARA